MVGCGYEYYEYEYDDFEVERGVQFYFFQKIDFFKFQCLNEVEEGLVKNVFKLWDECLDIIKFVESDVDEEFLFNIFFVG